MVNKSLTAISKKEKSIQESFISSCRMNPRNDMERKVDRGLANHSLSSTAIQQKFQHSLSLLFLVPGCNRQAKEGQIAAWRSGTKKQERKGINHLVSFTISFSVSVYLFSSLLLPFSHLNLLYSCSLQRWLS